MVYLFLAAAIMGLGLWLYRSSPPRLLLPFAGLPGALRPWLLLPLILSCSLVPIYVWRGAALNGVQSTHRIVWRDYALPAHTPSTKGLLAPILGGDRGLVGWPDGLMEPELSFTGTATGGWTLAIKGNRAFLYDVARKAFQNGTALEPGKPLDTSVPGEAAVVERIPGAHWWSAEQLRLRVGTSAAITFDLPKARSNGKPKVLPLGQLVADELIRLRGSGAAALAEQIETWADAGALLVARNEVRILCPGHQGSVHATAARFARNGAAIPFQLYRPKHKIAFTLNPHSGLLQFQAPFLNSAPIPDPLTGPDGLKVGARAEPGDFLFELPVHPDTTVEKVGLPWRPTPDENGALGGSYTLERPGTGSRATLGLALVHFEMHSGVLAGILLLAAASLLLVRHLTRDLYQGPQEAPLDLLAGCLWLLASLRVLLAMRYALDPSQVDDHAVAGLALSCGALFVVPALPFASACLHLGFWQERCPPLARWKYLGALALMGGVGALVWRQAATWLWVIPGMGRLGLGANLLGLFGWLVFALFLGTRMGSVVFRTLWPANLDGARRRWWHWPTLILPFWPYLRARWGAEIDVPIAKVLACLAPVLLGLLLLLVKFFPPLFGSPFVHEVLIPIGVLVPSLLFWLSPGAHLRRKARERTSRVHWLLLTALFLGVPLLIPAFAGDTGGVLGGFAFWIPVAILTLCLKPTSRAMAWGTGLVAAILALWFLAAWGLPLLAEKRPGSLRAMYRITAFVEGPGAARRLLDLQARGQVGQLYGALEHTWENQTMARLGGVEGLGYGAAPSRASQIRQDTVQLDSVFSFFILSEHGAIGGLCLLGLFACPLAVGLMLARKRVHTGQALALVLAGALFLEASLHALMNVGLLPFTGRNLPLLSVNSGSDLLRWTLLLGLMVQALFWGQDPSKEGLPPLTEAFAPYTRASARTPYPVAVRRALVTLGVVVLAWSAWGIQRTQLTEPTFNLASRLFEALKVRLRDGRLRLVEDEASGAFQLVAKQVRPGSMLEQEVARFNALPRLHQQGLSDEGIQADPSRRQPGLRIGSRLFTFRGGVSDYDEAMNALRELDSVQPNRRRTLMFLVTNHQHELGEEGDMAAPPEGAELAEGLPEPEGPPQGIIINPAFATPHEMKLAQGTAEIPEAKNYAVEMKDRRKTRIPLAGWAWVSGRYRLVTSPRWPLPDYLAGTLGHPLLREATGGKPMVITIDPELQQMAAQQAQVSGRIVHDDLLKRLHPKHRSEIGKIRPPRVALSVIEVGSGEILAMSGWPRSSPGTSWKRDANGEWLPPSRWLSASSRAVLAQKYLGEKNFDLLVMGSASKPLWAAMTLLRKPELGKSLFVRGSGEPKEHSIFGVAIGAPWDVHTSTAWLDLPTYLAQSDNAYQVRIGFLGLAEKTERGGVAGVSNPAAKQEAMDGKGTPWRQFPSFPPAIRLSLKEPSRIRLGSLADSELAKDFQQRFDVQLGSVSGRDPGGSEQLFRQEQISFWSGDEAHDAQPPAEFARYRSPAKSILDFASIDSSRKFVGMLLGGQENQWNNLQFPAALSQLVTGQPITPHLLKGVEVKSGRPAFSAQEVRQLAPVRQGMARVITRGTATSYLAPILSQLRALEHKGWVAYGKTGTMQNEDFSVVEEGALREDGTQGRAHRRKGLIRETSRLGFVIYNEKRKQGYAISMVIERTGPQYRAAHGVKDLLRWMIEHGYCND